MPESDIRLRHTPVHDDHASRKVARTS